MRKFMTSKGWFTRACSILPGGVSSPVRAFKGVGGEPRIIARAEGAMLFDVEGRAYIDYVGSWGAMILGHAHPAVTEAIARAAGEGTSIGLCSPREVELAEEIRARVPAAQRVRFVNSGTEAVMSAIRLARAATGRAAILKFSGGYHGHADAMLVRAGSGAATLGLPDSPGVTPGSVRDTLTAAYNDEGAIADVFKSHDDRLAAVMVEPVAGNMGVVPPQPEFLTTLRRLCSAHGVLLIFDEVMTGFRVAQGGATARYGVEPDLITFGKIIGGGLPVAAYAGRAELMNLVAPGGPVYQAGTLSGNPLGMAAGLATLRELKTGKYEELEAASSRLADGLQQALARFRVRGCVQRVGSMLTVFFGLERVRNFTEAAATDHARFARFFHAMLDRGVHLPPSGYEAWFVSTAHDRAVIDRTLAAVDDAMAEAVRGTG
ncbi:MAG: glutamate-1-semialdehyde 2,1-aminomutase [Phycisphaerales bacterium]|nr:glutamate-1-semialdehyde 2,1-aminomutase [Phycisphaerales bacterium]